MLHLSRKGNLYPYGESMWYRANMTDYINASVNEVVETTEAVHETRQPNEITKIFQDFQRFNYGINEKNVHA